jgi:hypothetical protein
VTYVYGAEASNEDIHARSISPLIRKCLEGYNVCVMLFGATGKQTAAAGAAFPCTRHAPGMLAGISSSKELCTAQGCSYKALGPALYVPCTNSFLWSMSSSSNRSMHSIQAIMSAGCCGKHPTDDHT